MIKWLKSLFKKPIPVLEPLAFVQETKKRDFTISEEGLQHLILEEGYRDRMYKDIKGYPTIGVGHLITEEELKSRMIMLSSGEKVSIHARWTKKQVSLLLRDDLVRFEKVVNTLKEYINQGQFDALVSFAFNIGVSGFKGSTAARYVKESRHSEVPGAMLMWNKPEQLIGRRTREAQKYADFTT